jgi:branched-chain amino acid aminotransferase
MSDFGAVEVTIAPASAPLDCGPTPPFGRVFTPAMLVAEWRGAGSAPRDAGANAAQRAGASAAAARPALDPATGGWGSARIVPQGEIGVHPGAVVFHYGQAIFEGMKAYRQPDGRLAIFRAREHAARFIRSAERMAMPPIPPDLFIAYLSRFVEHQGAALPDHPGMALYLRPLMIGVEAGLGIRAATEYLFVIMGCPVAPYFARSVEGGLRVQVSDEYVRAAPGGTGAVKAAGNYGRGLRALRDAKTAGYDQIIWLDARERSWVEEMEGMNFFYVRRGALLTPAASETILPGVTRASLLTLARDEGIEAREEPIRIETLMDGIASGEVTEAFAAGTAVVVAPISELLWRGRSEHLSPEHPVATRIHTVLSTYQTGRVPDRYEWLTPITPAR